MSVIKNIRKQLGYTQHELAKKTKLSLRTIQRLEASNKAPSGHTLNVLSEVFQMKPTTLQEEFRSIEEIKNSQATLIQILNLSVLSCIGIPFGNIIIPLILWRVYKKYKLVNKIARRIINVQFIWWLVLAFMLSISPFISRNFFSGRAIILYVLFFAYIFNVIIVCNTAIKLRRHDYNVLNISLRLL